MEWGGYSNFSGRQRNEALTSHTFSGLVPNSTFRRFVSVELLVSPLDGYSSCLYIGVSNLGVFRV